MKNFLTYTLTRLGVDYIDIYRPARLDPQVPIEDTIGAISDLIKAGYVRYVGLSEVGPETIRRAHAVHAICDLQIEYSAMTRGPEPNIFPTLAKLGIGVTAYGVLCTDCSVAPPNPLVKVIRVSTCHDFTERILSTIKNSSRRSVRSQGKRV